MDHNLLLPLLYSLASYTARGLGHPYVDNQVLTFELHPHISLTKQVRPRRAHTYSTVIPWQKGPTREALASPGSRLNRAFSASDYLE